MNWQRNGNIQTSHIENDTNISNERIIEKASHKKGRGEELKQKKIQG